MTVVICVYCSIAGQMIFADIERGDLTRDGDPERWAMCREAADHYITRVLLRGREA